MKYQGRTNYQHGEHDHIGLLIVNLGTPEAPTTPSVRRYLAEFLADPRVVEIPRLLWLLILHGIILRVRPKRSAANYQEVWMDEGSPLMVYSKAQQQALQQRFGQLNVKLAMRYGNPSIPDTVEQMLAQGVKKLLVLPLYPQYSAATTATVFDKLSQDLQKRRWLPDMRFISHYHDFPPYIEAMAKHIEAHWQQHGRGEKLVLSYHGLPERNLKLGDPYHCECYKTSRLLTERLGLDKAQVMTTFQSRFGKAKWLEPYTDATMKALPGQGVKSIDVFCPGFAADCLETLEEIEGENREYFEQAGGETFHYIPALNATDGHIDALADLIELNLQGWQLNNDDKALQAKLAKEMGA
ncbi:ferrochelatase [Salinibius halmophilus]|uniref:ferrochelatase n=1 Tax=Salinibius halmophilus TaxID=1853216 RepID=UPI000E66C2B5|nr:ferrochelatase [Salinibius halmophilus]